jgi:heterotetrameric sarcosine oxidase gamma subunit
MIEGAGADHVLRAAWGTPELAIGAGAEAGPGQVYRLRSDYFFVHTAPGAQTETARLLTVAGRETTSPLTVTDVTHGRAEFRLAGPAAGAVLSQLCALDLSPAAFPHLTARFTSLAKTRQLLIRRDEDGLPSFAIIGPRSLAAYLLETLLVAGRDQGLALIEPGSVPTASMTL